MLESFGGGGYASSRIWVWKVNPHAWGFVLGFLLLAGESQSVCVYGLFFIISWSKQSHRACKSPLIVLFLFCWGNAELSNIQTIQLTIMRMQKRPGFGLFSGLLWMHRNLAFCALSAATVALVKYVSFETAAITTLYRKQLPPTLRW